MSRPFLIASIGAALLAMLWANEVKALGCTGSSGCSSCQTAHCSGSPNYVWSCSNKTSGTTCNDGDPCTYNDQCDGDGNCAGIGISCPSTTCAPNSCRGTSTCTNPPPAASGTGCDDSDACTTGDACNGAGVCVGTRVNTSGDVTHFVVPSGTSTSGSAFYLPIFAENSSNVAVTGYSGPVSLSCSDGTATYPTSVTLTNGTALVTVTLRAISASITFTVSGPKQSTCDTNTPTNGVGTYNDVPAPVATVTEPTAYVTAGTSGLTASVATQSGMTYAWSITGGSIQGSTTGTSISFTAGSSGTVTPHVVVTNAAGATANGSALVTICSSPSAAFGNSQCASGTLSASPSTVTLGGPTMLSWTGSALFPTSSRYQILVAGGSIYCAGGTSGTYSPTVSSSSVTYSLVATSGCGSTSGPVLATATVAGAPAPSMPVITAPTLVSPSQTGLTASVPAQTGITFAWSLPGGSISAPATGTSITFAAGSAGIETLTAVATNAAGTTATGTATIAIPGPVTWTGSHLVTQGSSQTLAWSATALPSGFSYNLLAGTTTYCEGNSANGSYSFSAPTASTVVYQLVAAQSCPASGLALTPTFSMQSFPAPTPNVTLSSPTYNAGAAGSASAPSQAGMVYSWGISGGSIQGATNGTTVNFTAGASGIVSLSVRVQNAAGDAVTATSTAIIQSANATITAPSSAQPYETGLIASAMAEPGWVYSWTVGNGALTSQSSDGSWITFSSGAAGDVELSLVVTDAANNIATGMADLVIVHFQCVEDTPNGSGSDCIDHFICINNRYQPIYRELGSACGGCDIGTCQLPPGSGPWIPTECAVTSRVQDADATTFAVAAPNNNTVTAGVPFNLTITAYNPEGAFDSQYNGTLTLIVNGDPSASYPSSIAIDGGVAIVSVVANSGIAIEVNGTMQNNACDSVGPVGGVVISVVRPIPQQPTIMIVSGATSYPGATTTLYSAPGTLVTAWVEAHTGMTYAWSILGGSGGSFDANGFSAGSIVNGKNTVEFVAGLDPSEQITLSCAESNGVDISDFGYGFESIDIAPATPPIAISADYFPVGFSGSAVVPVADLGYTYTWSFNGGSLGPEGASGLLTYDSNSGQYVNTITFTAGAVSGAFDLRVVQSDDHGLPGPPADAYPEIGTAGYAVSFSLGGPSNALPGQAFDVAVTALDAIGNIAVGFQGSVILSADGYSNLPTSYTFSPSDNGQHTFSSVVVDSSQPIVTIKASDDLINPTIIALMPIEMSLVPEQPTIILRPSELVEGASGVVVAVTARLGMIYNWNVSGGASLSSDSTASGTIVGGLNIIKIGITGVSNDSVYISATERDANFVYPPSIPAVINARIDGSGDGWNLPPPYSPDPVPCQTVQGAWWDPQLLTLDTWWFFYVTQKQNGGVSLNFSNCLRLDGNISRSFDMSDPTVANLTFTSFVSASCSADLWTNVQLTPLKPGCNYMSAVAGASAAGGQISWGLPMTLMKVPDIPSGEDTVLAGVTEEEAAMFAMTLRGDVNYGGRRVHEIDAAPASDGCWISGSPADETLGVTGSYWDVQPDNTYWYDANGWGNPGTSGGQVANPTWTVVDWYQRNGGLPCSILAHQAMQIDSVADDGSVKWTTYQADNEMLYRINYDRATISVRRGNSGLIQLPAPQLPQ